MEKIILSDVQGTLYSNYKERITAFFEKKFLRKKIIFILISVPVFIFVLVVINLFLSSFLSLPPNVTRVFSVIAGIASVILPFRFADSIKANLEYQLEKSSSCYLLSGYYEINFADSYSLICNIKKEELQTLFKEEVKKEIERIDTITKEDLERIEKEGKGIYKHKVLKKMKKELGEILLELEK